MNLPKSPFILCLAALLLTTQTCAQQSVQQIVASQFPPDLTQPPVVAGPSSCSVVYDTYPTGSPRLIVAAYTNGVWGNVRMLSVNEQGSVSVAADLSKAQFEFSGANCRMSTVNLAADSSADPRLAKAIQVDFAAISGHGSATWLFLWDGGALLNITPLDSDTGGGPPSTELLTASTVEVAKNHAREIRSVGDGDLGPTADGIQQSPTSLLWAFDGQKYVPDSEALLWAVFRRSKGAPTQVISVAPESCDAPSCMEFDVRSPANTYSLVLFNGSADGGNRASSARVLLNNVQVIGPSDLNQNVATVTKSVSLAQRNTLLVILDGAPEGQVSVAIQAAKN